MRILSFDVGIKNLAYCYFDTSCQTILDWAVVDLCDDKRICSTAYCGKNATYTKYDLYFCNKHVKDFLKKQCQTKTCVNVCGKERLLRIHEDKSAKINCELVMDCTSAKLKHYADLFDIKQTIECACDQEETQTIKNTKNTKKPKKVKIPTEELRSLICEYIDDNLVENVISRNAKNVDLVEIGRNLDKYFTNMFDIPNLESKSTTGNQTKQFEIPDIILIENQISPIANRMKTIQGMIAQYFITQFKQKEISVRFISSSNKLKGYDEENINVKTTYDERKKKGIEVTNKLLEDHISNKTLWFDVFNKHSKKDDLADSYLQALWYARNCIKNI